MKTRLAIALFGCVATATQAANAQQAPPWLQGRQAGEGIGIRVDNLELHPGVAAQAGYDSNFLQRSSNACSGCEFDGAPLAFWRFKLTPHLYLSTLGSQRMAGAAPPTVAFRGGVSATANLLVPAERDAKKEARELHDVSASANLKLDILPQRPWGGDVYAQFERSVEPSNSPDNENAWDRDALVLGAGVIWRPNGGVFDWRLGYEFRTNFFEQDNFRNLNNVHHTLNTRNRWKFLPRTALMHMTELGFVGYTTDDPVLPDSTTVRTRIGLNGLVTHHFGLLALLGWGSSFYDTGFGPQRDFDSVIAQTQATWYIMTQSDLPDDPVLPGLSSIAAGYVRQFTNNYLSYWYQLDRIYLQANYAIANRVTMSAEAGYGYYTFPPVYWDDLRPEAGGRDRVFVLRHPDTERNWHQHRFDLTGFAEYALTQTVAANFTARYTTNTERPDNIVLVGYDDAQAPVRDDLSFRRFEAYLGIRWFM